MTTFAFQERGSQRSILELWVARAPAAILARWRVRALERETRALLADLRPHLRDDVGLPSLEVLGSGSVRPTLSPKWQ